jgi:hypothetical protein
MLIILEDIAVVHGADRLIILPLEFVSVFGWTSDARVPAGRVRGRQIVARAGQLLADLPEPYRIAGIPRLLHHVYPSRIAARLEEAVRP